MDIPVTLLKATSLSSFIMIFKSHMTKMHVQIVFVPESHSVPGVKLQACIFKTAEAVNHFISREGGV